MLALLTAYDDYPDELTVREAAIILQLSPQTVRQYIRQGKLPCYHIGRRYIVHKSAVRDFIQAAKVATPTGRDSAETTRR